MLANYKTITFIVIAQFLCTSLWFVGNIIVPQIPITQLADSSLIGNALTAVQLGFITGTFLFALFSVADRYSPSSVFAISAGIAALCNLIILLPGLTITTLLTSRFLTGFFLAGIYPVGMKIASDYFKEGLGKALGFLVGALVMGTALPHLIHALGFALSYQTITLLTSLLALSGGALIFLFVPDGPYRKRQAGIRLKVIPVLFAQQNFRKAAFAYFGHMWELYAFWGFVPLFLKYYAATNNLTFNIPLFAFLILGIGGLSCALGGVLSEKWGSKKVALLSVLMSGIFCLVSPAFINLELGVCILVLMLWGAVVVSDSPQLSSLVAQHAIAQYRATALTIVNCIGFAITIISIQILVEFSTLFTLKFMFVVLAIGPIFSVINLLLLKDKP